MAELKFYTMSLLKWLFIVIFRCSLSLFALFIFPNHLNAQFLSKVDSLTHLLNQNIDDTTRVNVLNLLSFFNYTGSDDSLTYQFAAQALALAEKSSFKRGQAKAYLNLTLAEKSFGNYKACYAYNAKALGLYNEISDQIGMIAALRAQGRLESIQQNWSEAIKYMETAESKYRQIRSIFDSKRDTILVYVLGDLGFYYKRIRDYKKSRYYSQEALSIAQAINFKGGALYPLMTLGDIDRFEGDPDSALIHYELSIEMTNQWSDFTHMSEDISKRNLGYTYGQAALLYANKDNPIKSRQNFEKALEIAIAMNETSLMATYMYNIGLTYSKQNNIPAARENYQKVLSLRDLLDDKSIFVKTYINLGNCYKREGNIREAIQMYTSALELAKQQAGKNDIDLPYNNIALCYKHFGDFAEARNNFLQALKIEMENKNKYGIGEAYRNIADVYTKEGNYIEAIRYYKLSLAIMEELGNKERIAFAKCNMGNVYVDQGKYTEALKLHLEAIALLKETGSDQLGHPYISLGALYARQGNYIEAESTLKMAVDLLEKSGRRLDIADAYSTLGDLYHDQGKTKLAMENYQLSLNIGLEFGAKDVMANMYESIGKLYFDEKDYSKALENYIAALSMNRKTGENRGIASALLDIGEVYTCLHKFEEAENYLEDGLSLAKEMRSKSLIKSAYETFMKLDSAQENFEKAFDHFKLFRTYNDSLTLEQNNEVVHQLQIQFESERKDGEIAQLINESRLDSLQFLIQQESLKSIHAEKDKVYAENLSKQRQVNLLISQQKLQQLELDKKQADLNMQKADSDRKQDQLALMSTKSELQSLELKRQKQIKNYFIGSLGLLLLLFFFVYNNYITRQKLKLQTLRNKIASDLHDDVGSTLSSISIFSEIARQKFGVSDPMLENIQDSSKKMLEAMGDIVWAIKPENDHFERVVLRMRSFAYQLLNAMKLDFEFEVDDSISKLHVPMEVRKNLYLIFKEATNNMVKYSEATKAQFSIREINDHLTLLVRDNGKGFDMNAPNEGNGLRNMKQRAEEIGGKLEIVSSPGNGTLIQLKVAV